MDRETDKTYVECHCHSAGHIIRFEHDEEPNLIYLTYHLEKLCFWKRILYATKYIFGFQSRFGAFGNFIIGPKQAKKMKKTLDKIKEE